MTRVGWIGLGAMGAPMAECAAQAGHEVIAFDVDPARTQVARAGEAATGVDLLVLMVATPEQLDPSWRRSRATSRRRRPS